MSPSADVPCRSCNSVARMLPSVIPPAFRSVLPTGRAGMPFPAPLPGPPWQNDGQKPIAAAIVCAVERLPLRNECDGVCSVGWQLARAPNARDGWDQTFHQIGQYSCVSDSLLISARGCKRGIRFSPEWQAGGRMDDHGHCPVSPIVAQICVADLANKNVLL